MKQPLRQHCHPVRAAATALDSRPIIEHAKGILMGERRCIAEEAFEVLAEISQHATRKLRDVATALVEQAHPSPDIRGAK